MFHKLLAIIPALKFLEILCQL
jgi:hypothetical protein